MELINENYKTNVLNDLLGNNIGISNSTNNYIYNTDDSTYFIVSKQEAETIPYSEFKSNITNNIPFIQIQFLNYYITANKGSIIDYITSYTKFCEDESLTYYKRSNSQEYKHLMDYALDLLNQKKDVVDRHITFLFKKEYNGNISRVSQLVNDYNINVNKLFNQYINSNFLMFMIYLSKRPENNLKFYKGLFILKCNYKVNESIKAYHGSDKTDIIKFNPDMTKSMVHGWGVYFTDNRDLATLYSTGRNQSIIIDGRKITNKLIDNNNLGVTYYGKEDELISAIEEIVDYHKKDIAKYPDNFMHEINLRSIKQGEELLDLLKNAKTFKVDSGTSKVYNVELFNKKNPILLNWYEPLSDWFKTNVVDKLDISKKDKKILKNNNGEFLYNYLTFKLFDKDKKKASLYLYDTFKVDGIVVNNYDSKYYIVFNADDITMLNENKKSFVPSVINKDEYKDYFDYYDKNKIDLDKTFKLFSDNIGRYVNTTAVNESIESDEFKAWFGNSKVVDSNGEPLIVYHGSQAEFDEFEGYSFFTDDYMNADGYAGGEYVYEVYLKIDNPLVIDCKGRMYNDLETPYGTTTHEVVSKTDSNKYDGIIFNNIKDSWIDDEEFQEPSTVYVTFKPNQIKLADNNTFNPESNKINEEVLDEKLSAYHGTNKKFEYFSDEYVGAGVGKQAYGWGMYFSNLKEVANDYANRLAPLSVFIGDEDVYDLGDKYDNNVFYHIHNYVVDGLSKSKIIKKLTEILDDSTWFEKNPFMKKEQYEQVLDYLKKNDIYKEQSDKHIYNVTIGKGESLDDLNLVEWESKLSEENKENIRNGIINSKNDRLSSYVIDKTKMNDLLNQRFASIYVELSRKLMLDKNVSLFLLNHCNIDGIIVENKFSSLDEEIIYVIFDVKNIKIDEVDSKIKSKDLLNESVKSNNNSMPVIDDKFLTLFKRYADGGQIDYKLSDDKKFIISNDTETYKLTKRLYDSLAKQSINIDSYKSLYKYTPKQMVDFFGFEGFNSEEDAIEYLEDMLNTDFPLGYKNMPSELTLYRVLYLEDKNDYNIKDFGLHYIADKNSIDDNFLLSIGAESFSDDAKPYIFTVKVKRDDISFHYSINNNLQYPREYELTLKSKNVKVDIIDIEEYDKVDESIITEAKQLGDLYHFTDFLYEILRTDTFHTSDNKVDLSIVKYDIDGTRLDYKYYMSLTRNKNSANEYTNQRTARIVFDGTKLSNKYKIVPIHYLNLNKDKDGIKDLRDLTKNPRGAEFNEYEERLLTNSADIKGIIKYIKRIDISIEDRYVDSTLEETMNNVLPESIISVIKDNNIPVSFYLKSKAGNRSNFKREVKFDTVNELLVNEDLTSIITEDHDTIEKIYETLANHLKLNIIKVLGYGANGTAFEIEDNKVLKISTDISEYKYAKAIIENDGNLNHIVKVYNTYHFSYDRKTYVVLITEKLVTDNVEFHNTLRFINNELFKSVKNVTLNDLELNFLDGDITLDELRNKLQVNDDSYILNIDDKYNMSLKVFIDNFINILIDMKKLKYNASDLHAGNIGYSIKDKNLKLIDVGFMDYDLDAEDFDIKDKVTFESNYIIEAVSEGGSMINKIANKIAKMRNYTDINILGEGHYGKAYEIVGQPDKIMKVSLDKTEYFKAKKILTSNKFKHFPIIYSVNYVDLNPTKPESKDIMVVNVIERLKHYNNFINQFNRYYDMVIIKASKAYEFDSEYTKLIDLHTDILLEELDIEAIKEILNRYIKVGGIPNVSVSIGSIKINLSDYINQMIDLTVEMKELGYETTDFHSGNLTFDSNGVLKLIDLGDYLNTDDTDFDEKDLLKESVSINEADEFTPDVVDKIAKYLTTNVSHLKSDKCNLIGEGSYGNAYILSHDRVMKISTDKAEYKYAKKIIDNPNFKHINKIQSINHFKLNSNRMTYIVIVSDLVNVDEDLGYKIIKEINRLVKLYFFTSLSEFLNRIFNGVNIRDIEKYKEMIRSIHSNNINYSTQNISTNLYTFTTQLIDLVYEMKEIGYTNHDLHSGNIGFTKGSNRLVLIDYGVYDKSKIKLGEEDKLTKVKLNENLKFDSKIAGIFKSKPEYLKSLLKQISNTLNIKIGEQIGIGTNAMVYNIDSEKVFKMTIDLSEYTICKRILDADNKFNHLPIIYDAKYIKNNSGNVFCIIVMEKIKPISESDFDNLINIDKVKDVLSEDISIDEMNDILAKNLKYIRTIESTTKDSNGSIYKINKEFHNLLRELKSVGYSNTDFTIENLGYKSNGKLTLMDLGEWTPLTIKDEDISYMFEDLTLNENRIEDLFQNDEIQYKDLIQKIAKFLNIKIGKEIGQGNNAIAYVTNDNKIFKITTDLSEYKNCKAILNNGNRFNHLPTIYDVKYIKTRSGRILCIIVMEKLNNIDVDDYNNIIYIENMNELLSDKTSMDEMKIELEDILEINMPKYLETAERKAKKHLKEFDKNAVYSINKQFHNMLIELKSIGYDRQDLTFENLGIKSDNNKLSILDLGTWVKVPEPSKKDISFIHESDEIKIDEESYMDDSIVTLDRKDKIDLNFDGKDDTIPMFEDEQLKIKVDVSDKIMKALNISDYKMLASGYAGTAYSISNDKVIKITTDGSEYKTAKYFIQNNNYKHIAKVYDAKYAEVDNRIYFIITLEKLITDFEKMDVFYFDVDSLIKDIYRKEYNTKFTETDYLNGEISDDIMIKIKSMVLDSMKGNKKTIDINGVKMDYISFINNFFDMMKEMKDSGQFNSSEITAYNMGFDMKAPHNLKLLDLGTYNDNHKTNPEDEIKIDEALSVHNLDDLIDKVASKLKIKLNKKLGHGNNAVAYLTSNNKVFKLSKDKSEYTICKNIIKSDNKFNNLPEVYDVKYIKSDTDVIIVILMEYLTPIDAIFKDIYQYIANTDGRSYSSRKIISGEVELTDEMIKHHLDRIKQISIDKNDNSIYTINKEFVNMLKELISVGYNNDDLTYTNLGFKTDGKLAPLDLGYWRTPDVDDNQDEIIIENKSESVELIKADNSDKEMFRKCYLFMIANDFATPMGYRPNYIYVDSDNNVLGLSTSFIKNGVYSFDILVDESLRGKNLGSKLIDINIKDAKSMTDIKSIEVDITNKNLYKPFMDRGFELSDNGEGKYGIYKI